MCVPEHILGPELVCAAEFADLPKLLPRIDDCTSTSCRGCRRHPWHRGKRRTSLGAEEDEARQPDAAAQERPQQNRVAVGGGPKLFNLADLGWDECDAQCDDTFITSLGLKLAAKMRGRAKAWIKETGKMRQTRSKSEAEAEISAMGAIMVSCFAGIYEGLVGDGAAVGRAGVAKLQEVGKEMEKLSVAEMGELVPMAKGGANVVLAFSNCRNMASALEALVQALDPPVPILTTALSEAALALLRATAGRPREPRDGLSRAPGHAIVPPGRRARCRQEQRRLARRAAARLRGVAGGGPALPRRAGRPRQRPGRPRPREAGGPMDVLRRAARGPVRPARGRGGESHRAGGRRLFRLHDPAPEQALRQ
ncbi:unnamed protein product, partial [Prorocentrum cordatum]